MFEGSDVAVSRNGDVIVLSEKDGAASRVNGVWSAGIAWSVDDLEAGFVDPGADKAASLAKEASMSLGS